MGESEMSVTHESLVVNAPVADVYQRWLHFEDLPQFIKTMRNVQRIDDTHFSVNPGPLEQTCQSTIEVIFRNPGRRIAWRIISANTELGVVSFEPQPDGATEVTLKLRSAFNPLLSSDRARQYLADFKSLVETPAPDNQS